MSDAQDIQQTATTSTRVHLVFLPGTLQLLSQLSTLIVLYEAWLFYPIFAGYAKIEASFPFIAVVDFIIIVIIIIITGVTSFECEHFLHSQICFVLPFTHFWVNCVFSSVGYGPRLSCVDSYHSNTDGTDTCIKGHSYDVMM